MPIFQSIVDSPLGPLLIGATERNVVSISFTENPATQSSNALTDLAAKQLEEYFHGERQTFDLPLGGEGTAFEREVWRKLTDIPFGATCSYQDIAKGLNNLGAIRAVGRANGKNPIAILVPCHRVIGSDGKLTGYAGELWRKRWLLDHEARLAGTLLI